MIKNDELRKKWEETAVMEYFKVPFQHFPGGTCVNHKKIQVSLDSQRYNNQKEEKQRVHVN
jgi:hypothetical protein